MITTSPAMIRHLQNIENELSANQLNELRGDTLYNDRTFYRAFIRDLLAARSEVVIVCPFITKYRADYFKSTLKQLQHRNIAVFIITRPVNEHDLLLRNEATVALKEYESLGIHVTFVPGFIHEKLAIIDREILWEGSLNILSQRKSREMMRRLPDDTIAKQTMRYLGLNQWLVAGYKSQYERLYRSLVDGARERQARALLFVGIALTVVIFSLWLLSFLHGTIGIVKTITGMYQLLNLPIR